MRLKVFFIALIFSLLLFSCNKRISLSEKSTNLLHDKIGMWKIESKKNGTISTDQAISCASRFFNSTNLKGINRADLNNKIGFVERKNYQF